MRTCASKRHQSILWAERTRWHQACDLNCRTSQFDLLPLGAIVLCCWCESPYRLALVTVTRSHKMNGKIVENTKWANWNWVYRVVTSDTVNMYLQNEVSADVSASSPFPFAGMAARESTTNHKIQFESVGIYKTICGLAIKYHKQCETRGKTKPRQACEPFGLTVCSRLANGRRHSHFFFVVHSVLPSVAGTLSA